jgi:hypothetical protein
MKAKSPVAVALVLWFLYFATNAFAVLKSAYPHKAYPPGQIVIVTDDRVGPIAGTTTRPK